MNTNSRDPRERNKIRVALLKGDAKFTWKNPRAERENLLAFFKKDKLDMNEIQYETIEDDKWETLIDCCSGVYPVHTGQ